MYDHEYKRYETEDLTGEEVLSWWDKQKNKVYAVVIFILGLLSGNVDRWNELWTMLGEFFGW